MLKHFSLITIFFSSVWSAAIFADTELYQKTLEQCLKNIEMVQQELDTNKALGICMFRQDESPKPKSFSGVKIKILDENNKRSSVIKCQRSKIHDTGVLVCKVDCDPASSNAIEGVIQFLDVDNNFVNSDVYFLVQDESTDFNSEDKDELKYEFLFENCTALTDTPIPNHIFLLYRTKLIDNLINRFGNNNIGNRF